MMPSVKQFTHLSRFLPLASRASIRWHDGVDMARAPDSLGFRFAVVLELAVVDVAIATWAFPNNVASAVPDTTNSIYRAQHVNLF